VMIEIRNIKSGRTGGVSPHELAPRRLAAIVAGDISGYSRLMQIDEEGTHGRVQPRRQMADQASSPVSSRAETGKSPLPSSTPPVLKRGTALPPLSPPAAPATQQAPP
jgi:hypothetical protein